jgi:geranylgeranyl transferase type-2 subunit alpha
MKCIAAVLQACLTENPKSYSTWHHRKWVVAQGLAPLERELQLVSR